MSHNPSYQGSAEIENGSSGKKAEVAREGILGFAPGQRTWVYPLKQNLRRPYDPTMPLPGRHLRERQACVYRETCTRTFLAALFLMAQAGETPHTSFGRRADELEPRIRVTTWVNLSHNVALRTRAREKRHHVMLFL